MPMHFIPDILIVIIISLAVYFGWRKGFVRTVAGLFGGIISFFLARFAANSLGSAVAELLPVPELGENLSAKINDVLLNSEASLSVQSLLEAIGIPSSLTASLREETGSAIAGAAGAAADRVALALTELLGWCLVFILAFVAAALLIRLFGVWLDIFSKLPVVRTLNSLLGGLTGILAGLFLAWLFAILLVWLTPTLGARFDIDLSFIDPSRTCLFRYFAAFNPLRLLF